MGEGGFRETQRDKLNFLQVREGEGAETVDGGGKSGAEKESPARLQRQAR